eukprot:EG_transcript_7891
MTIMYSWTTLVFKAGHTALQGTCDCEQREKVVRYGRREMGTLGKKNGRQHEDSTQASPVVSVPSARWGGKRFAGRVAPAARVPTALLRLPVEGTAVHWAGNCIELGAYEMRDVTCAQSGWQNRRLRVGMYFF